MESILQKFPINKWPSINQSQTQKTHINIPTSRLLLINGVYSLRPRISGAILITNDMVVTVSSENRVSSLTGNEGNVKLQLVTLNLTPIPRVGKSSIIEKPFELPKTIYNELVIVRVKGMISNNSSTSTTSADKKIPRESAVCRFCFRKFVVNDDSQNVLKTHCLCDMTLTHLKCAENWFGGKGNVKCEWCSQDIKFIPVVILSITPKAENSFAPPQDSTIGWKPFSGSFKRYYSAWMGSSKTRKNAIVLLDVDDLEDGSI